MQLRSLEKYQGFQLSEPVEISPKIVALVGRNGCGKSRFLAAIGEGKIQATLNGAPVPRERIILLSVDKLTPQLMFGFDPMRHRDESRQAMAFYEEHRGKFSDDPQVTLQRIAPNGGMAMRMQMFNPSAIAIAVQKASVAVGRSVNDLQAQDVADFLPAAQLVGLGAMNVTATMLTYWHRHEENILNDIRNERYKSDLPVWTEEGFRERFGPPPWDMFNRFLESTLDGKYRIKEPEFKTVANYEAKLYRDDGIEIDPNQLSSGEKVLMWLCLSMYASNTNRVANPPRLLLLDEPDAALHPQMVQKLHEALHTIVESFGSHVLFTTHSPTTIALMPKGAIMQVSETGLIPLQKDAAIGELLKGVDRISVHYTNRRQVYVESHSDAEIYGEAFHALRLYTSTLSPHISLAFIPASPKISTDTARQILTANLGPQDPEKEQAFLAAINGLGNCAQVIGTVEHLIAEQNPTVHGIIDWDLVNNGSKRVHVHGGGEAYSIENIILNPVSLGLYLISSHSAKIDLAKFGLQPGFDLFDTIRSSDHWQGICNAVTSIVLGRDSTEDTVNYRFHSGATIKIDKEYMFKQGHALQELVISQNAFPFLRALPRRPGLLVEVLTRTAHLTRCGALPSSFHDLFASIQEIANRSSVAGPEDYPAHR